MKPVLLATASLAATLALTLSGCSAVSRSSTTDSQAAAAAHEAAGDLPDGFHDAGDGLAVKTPDTVGAPCEASIGSCYQVLVYAERPCDIYVAANGLDASGTIVGYANDTATMAPGDTALLTFQFTQTVDDVKFTTVECH